MNKYLPMTVSGALVAFTVSVNAEAVNVLPGPNIAEQAKIRSFLLEGVDPSQWINILHCWHDGKTYSPGSVNNEGRVCECTVMNAPFFCRWERPTE